MHILLPQGNRGPRPHLQDSRRSHTHWILRCGLGVRTRRSPINLRVCLHPSRGSYQLELEKATISGAIQYGSRIHGICPCHKGSPIASTALFRPWTLLRRTFSHLRRQPICNRFLTQLPIPRVLETYRHPVSFCTRTHYLSRDYGYPLRLRGQPSRSIHQAAHTPISRTSTRTNQTPLALRGSIVV
jgi:hypothetical protein